MFIKLERITNFLRANQGTIATMELKTSPLLINVEKIDWVNSYKYWPEQVEPFAEVRVSGNNFVIKCLPEELIDRIASMNRPKNLKLASGGTL